MLKRRHLIPAALLLALVGSWSARPVAAQEHYNYTINLLGGLGGSRDAEPDPGFGNASFQLGASMVVEPRTHLGLRLGRLSLGSSDDALGSLSDARLKYATVAGEYRLRRPLHDSGAFVGLGAYRLSGSGPDGFGRSETAPGVTLGFSGEFPLTRWVSAHAELAGHYAFLDEAQVFGALQVGVAVHFR